MANRKMAGEATAQVNTLTTTAEDDYASFCGALESSARGRAFLAEYAKRNRSADTEMLLAALKRLEAMVRADRSALEKLRNELRMLLIAIRLAQPDIESASPQAKAGKLASLLDMLERRIETIAEARPDDIKPPEAPVAEIVRAPLAVVPPPEEPELPIPSPANDQMQPIALVRNAAMPEIAFDGNPPAKMAVAPVVETVAEAIVAPPAPLLAQSLAPKSAAALPAIDPLAPIMAMSEAERIALFT